MKNNKDMLSAIMKTTQMGQVGIRSVLDNTMCPDLREALESQLREYDTIETEAHSLATQRGWELSELDPAVRFMADMMTKARLNGKNVESKIAGMMIQGNTRGMIKGLKDMHQFEGEDSRIQILARKLLDCETSNIQQMKQFL